MGVGRILSREAKCGEISFYLLETKKLYFFAKNVTGKCQISKSRGGMVPPCPSSDVHEHGALSMGRRKGKAFRECRFALHRQQPEKDKQNVDVAPPGKISALLLLC